MAGSELASFIDAIQAVDTHEHLRKENVWTEKGPRDALEDLFCHYVSYDLISAGADPKAVERLLDGGDPDIEGRFAAIEPAWRAIEHNGYGQFVRMTAKAVYGIEEITGNALRQATPRLLALRQPGERLRLLRDTARLDHVQTDDGIWPCLPDAGGPDFFLYDLSWRNFADGRLKRDELARETGITVGDVDSLERAMEALFAKYAPVAIAVKSAHAYIRPLRWQKRDRADVARALQSVLRDEDAADPQERWLLGDWCLERACQWAAQFNLPVKLHTGHYAGNGYANMDYYHAQDLCPLLAACKQTRFVLMHTSYPFGQEILSMVKHFPNAYADLCWAWSLDPISTTDFVRRFLHTAPANKLFAFGGDTNWPTGAYGYSIQARRYLTLALQAEIDQGELTLKQAQALALRFLRENQLACFDLAGRRQAIAGQLVQPAPAGR